MVVVGGEGVDALLLGLAVRLVPRVAGLHAAAEEAGGVGTGVWREVVVAVERAEHVVVPLVGLAVGDGVQVAPFQLAEVGAGGGVWIPPRVALQEGLEILAGVGGGRHHRKEQQQALHLFFFVVKIFEIFSGFLQEKKKMRKEPNLDDVLSSWVLDALRRVFGYEDIRNLILQAKLGGRVAYGKTFGAEHKEKQLKDYLKKLLVGKKKHRLLLFTASNRALRGETHYQGFVVDYEEKHLWVVDPASVKGKEGIYASFVAREVVVPFFQAQGWETGFVRLSSACQATTDDVFCQTWTLWLLVRVARALLTGKKKLGVIRVPKKLTLRHKALLRFYKECLKVEGVCEELQATYRDTIRRSTVLVRHLSSKKEKEEVRRFYLAVDPCDAVARMNELDLMTEEQRNE